MNRKKNYYLLILTILGLMFYPNTSNAQIEDFQLGTTTRKMLVYAPSGIEANRPLLLSLHGMNQDINYQQNQTKWESVAKENNFVVVYPGGINNSWDIYGTSDIDFILAIIDEMYKRYEIDTNRVYLSGFSMGGMMTYFAANHIADKIAAFAPVSGYLMGGPNTNSKRPIPIIHTHGTTDDVVVYSGVQKCLDAWITRNNCPKTAVVTQPYPADKPNSNGTKYYWGPGTDSVEIVLLSIKNAGHWHSIDNNGVNTSKEIWNFCKRFSLDFGVPKFKYASVIDKNPKQILLSFNLPIKESDNFEGFTVKIDGQVTDIENIVLTDSVHIAINLINSILNNNEISLSYKNGSLVSIYDKKLTDFTDLLVENMLYGASPRIVELATTQNGDTLVAKFNKKMQLPTNISSLGLSADYEGDKNISLVNCTFLNNDSTIFVFPLGEKVYADYILALNYSGNNIASADAGYLKNLIDYKVNNKAKGLPVYLKSGKVEENAITIALEFSKSMTFTDQHLKQLTFEINGKNASVKEYFVLKNSIRFTLKTNVYFGDTISASYVPGNITAADKGDLEAFSNFIIENPVIMPTYFAVPGKIEAEDYSLQFGTDKEQTGDAGGGQNVGWIDTGDWLVYAIENNAEEAEYEITFRVAAQSAGGKFDFYLDNEKAGQIVVPGTGGWQTWQSVVKNITVGKGKHYLKVIATASGFNINYFEISEIQTVTKELLNTDVSVYPNPVSDVLYINTKGIKHNRIEIFDIIGSLVLSKNTKGETCVKLPINLPDGLYFLKINETTQFKVRKIIVNKK